MTTTEKAIHSFKPLTSETRVEDFVIPTHIELGGELVELPKCIRRKDPHFLLSPDGTPVRAAWITKPLAHILNSKRFDSAHVKVPELQRALKAVDSTISQLIKGILKDKHGPGAMAFCQAHESVPKDSIVITSRTYDTLCNANKAWEKVKTVLAVRFPNLGPSTTQELKVIVNKAQGLDELLYTLPANAIGNRISNLQDLLLEFEETTEPSIFDGVVDAFYIHPENLKDGFQGDGRPTCR